MFHQKLCFQSPKTFTPKLSKVFYNFRWSFINLPQMGNHQGKAVQNSVSSPDQRVSMNSASRRRVFQLHGNDQQTQSIARNRYQGWLSQVWFTLHLYRCIMKASLKFCGRGEFCYMSWVSWWSFSVGVLPLYTTNGLLTQSPSKVGMTCSISSPGTCGRRSIDTSLTVEARFCTLS